jgi:hypothetical protein
MSFSPSYLVRQAARLASTAALLVALSGCQAVVNNAPSSQVRVINASPDAPSLDLYQGGNPVAYNLGFGAVTSYVPVIPGTYTIAANSAGTRQAVSSSRAALAASAQYTVLIGDVAGNLQQLILTDQNHPALPGQVSLRFIDQATRVPAVDIYLVPAGQKLTATSPTVTDIAFGANTGYLSVPTGAYTLAMLPTGTLPASTTAPTYTGTQITYPSGAARTIVLIDQQLLTTPGLQVVTAEDYDSPIN